MDTVTAVFGLGVFTPTIYHEIGSAADDTLLHSPRHVAVGLAGGYETLPVIGIMVLDFATLIFCVKIQKATLWLIRLQYFA